MSAFLEARIKAINIVKQDKQYQDDTKRISELQDERFKLQLRVDEITSEIRTLLTRGRRSN